MPDTNYRSVLLPYIASPSFSPFFKSHSKSHYIVSEYVDKVFNKHAPNYPWLVGVHFSRLLRSIVDSLTFFSSSSMLYAILDLFVCGFILMICAGDSLVTAIESQK
jgi:hypothetical protein